jgi:lambda family phage tail tape measure protein
MLAGGNAAFRRLSETEKAEAIAKQQRIVDLTDEAAAQKEATKEAQAFAVVQENLARLSIESSRKHGDVLASIGQGTKESADNAALQATLRQYDDLITQAGKANTKGEISDDLYAKEVAEYKKALGEQLAADKTYFAERDALQSDWHNGARAAMQDYVDQSANAAAEAQQLFANAFTSMENALLTFVTTGKFGFKSFVTSVLTDLARMELRVVESQILQSILGMFLMQSPIMSNSSIGANMDSSVSGDIAGYQSSMSTIPVAGGRASGGPVQGGNLYEVAEGGKPEMLVSGGRSYLLMGADGGHVIPAGGSSSTSSAGGAPTNVSVSINVVQDANGGSQMNSQTSALTEFGKQMAAEMESTARRVMSRGLQPGGDIYKTIRMGAPA